MVVDNVVEGKTKWVVVVVRKREALLELEGGDN